MFFTIFNRLSQLKPNFEPYLMMFVNEIGNQQFVQAELEFYLNFMVEMAIRYFASTEKSLEL